MSGGASPNIIDAEPSTSSESYYSFGKKSNENFKDERPSSTLLKSTSLPKIESDRHESKVLVLYTGGTIGMLRTSDGVYVPKQNLMKTKISAYPQLHDVEYAVASLGDPLVANFLVLPDVGEAFRVFYSIYEYSPLLDSSNMTMDDWIRIATDIKKHYESYHGFVILHGTDTMAYTASALSFMLENLGKTVVITGSQIPLYEARSDGRDNFMNSLIMAGNYCIPEVTILFSNKLFRGNRTSKVSTSCLEAFTSPNLTPLAEMGIKIHVDWRNVFKPSKIERFNVHCMLNRNVGLLRLFPSITVEVVRAFLSPPIEGVVLQTYGAGNGPSQRKDLFDEFRRATRRGVIIVNCTQCMLGQVETSYETGSALVDAGVVAGSDMTPEAALTKLSYVLTKTEWSVQTKRNMMKTNLRGELTVVCKDVKLDDLDIVTAVMDTLKLSTSEESDALKEALYPAMLCSIVAEGNLEKIEVMRQFGANMSACDYIYQTPLHIAAADGNVKIVEYLLEHGASVHMRDRDHRTPLMNAIDNDNHEVIEMLVKAGSYLNLPPTTIGEMLCCASRQNNTKRLQSLLLAKADLSEPDTTQRTALHYAVEMNHEDTVMYLHSHNANKTCKDVYGHTPYDVARLMNRNELMPFVQELPLSSSDET